MPAILEALMRSLRDLFQPKVLVHMLWPFVAALLLGLVLNGLFWDDLAAWLASGRAHEWLAAIHPHWIAGIIQGLVHLLLFTAFVMLTSLLLTAFFVMPMLIGLVAERHYPQLTRAESASLADNLRNALVAFAIFAAIWLLTLPLWLVGVGVVIPFIAASYLNQRMFRFDALAEHASREEMYTLFARHRLSWWTLGLLTGLLQFIPILNLLAPMLTALAFIHYALERLQKLRQG